MFHLDGRIPSEGTSGEFLDSSPRIEAAVHCDRFMYPQS